MAAKDNNKVAEDFQKLIQADREKRKAEKLAADIFGRGRKLTNGPGAGVRKTSSASPSLASRITSANAPKSNLNKTFSPKPAAGNNNAAWTRDLQNAGLNRNGKPRRLPVAKQYALANALSNASNNQANIKSTPTGPSSSSNKSKSNAKGAMNIRGLAGGPCIVQAQNFAPGTSAADITSAIAHITGPIIKCKLIATAPIVIAEIILPDRDSADRLVEAFNGQIADGLKLQLFVRPDAPTAEDLAPEPSATAASIPSGPRADKSRNDENRPLNRGPEVVDGTYGFDDRMETDSYSNGSQPAQRLYSDSITQGRRGGGNGFREDRRRGRGDYGRGYVNR